ncbi:MAG TPA: tetratricopeptide repeat protein [Bryobacteraceae bacterium]|nr:tetratricopeptide repeat protein [Bryobacteraceae bacterium]
MLRGVAMLMLAAAAFAAEPGVYEFSGRILPAMGARVALFGTDSPFSATTFAGPDGHFRFKGLRPGLYTLAIFNRRRGEARRTVDVGPGNAGRNRRVSLTVELRDSDFVFASTLGRHLVSTRQLSIPEAAVRDYNNAQKDLSRHDSERATKRLEHAVDLAPEFAVAWNSLGVIAYQTRQFDRAEQCFRKAVEADPQSFEALVNLGGVALTLHKLDDAMDYNLKAVLARPNDALANAQMGMAYYAAARLDLAVKYLEKARQIDPASFTFPQLLLFQIHVRRGERAAAAADLQDFLEQHPGWPQAAKMRQTIERLRSARDTGGPCASSDLGCGLAQ